MHPNIATAISHLHLACHHADEQLCRDILRHKDFICAGAVDEDGRTALHFAASAGHVGICKSIVIRKGAVADLRDARSP